MVENDFRLCLSPQILIFILTVFLSLISYGYSVADYDMGIGYSPLSVSENAYSLSFSTPVRKLRYGSWGLDGSFHMTQNKFDHQTSPEYSGGWGWYHYYKYYKSYWILTLGMFYGYEIKKSPISLKIGPGLTFENECIKKEKINTRAGNFYEHDEGSDNNLNVRLYLKPEIRLHFRRMFISFSIWENSKYLKETFLIGLLFK